MKKENNCVVSGILSLVLRASRFLGVAPLRFVPLQNGYLISLSYKYTVYSCIFVSFLNACGVIGFIADMGDKVTPNATFSELIFFIPKMILTIISSGIGSYNGVNRMKNMIDYLNGLKEIRMNTESKLDTRDPSERKRYALVLSYLGSEIILLLTVIYLNGAVDKRPMLIFTTYSIFYIEWISKSLLEVQVLILMLEIRSTLKLINKKMENTLSLAQENTVLTLPIIKKNVRQMAHAYVSVCDVVMNMNKNQGAIILLLFFYFIIMLITTGYNAIIMYTSLSKTFIFRQYILCVKYTFDMLVFVETSNSINKEVKKTNILLSKLIYRVTSVGDHIAFEFELLFKQLVLNEPRYAPMGMFTLERSLLITNISIILTYLLYIIQFE